MKHTIPTPNLIVGEWNYVCVNLYETLQEEFNVEANYFLVCHIFFENSLIIEDYWIDEVYISTKQPKSQSQTSTRYYYTLQSKISAISL